MKRPLEAIAAVGVLALALVFPAGAGARTEWICTVEGDQVVFVSAADAALHGLPKADSKAGVVFENQFGEVNCHIESNP
jgi:hypothetical protein